MKDGGKDRLACATCRAGNDRRHRFCWLRGGNKRVVFMAQDSRFAMLLSKELLCALLPRRDPVKYLLDEMGATIDGKAICPVPLGALYPDAERIIDTECDMTGGDGGWGALPFGGPTSEWPAVTLKLLRHTRAVKGIHQSEDFAVPPKDKTP